MKKRLTRIISAFLILLLALGTVIACADDGNAPAESETVPVTEDNIPAINPDLPERDFEKHEFKILTRYLDHPDWVGVWDPVDVCVEDENAEPINDAVYRRNSMVEEKYNIKLVQCNEEVISGSFDNAMNEMLYSGDDMYDLVLPGTSSLSTYVSQKAFLDFNALDYIDFEEPWWDQRSIDMTLGGKLFFIEGDMLINYKNASAATVFNKQLAVDYKIGSVYDMVNDGSWTFDKMMDLTKNVAGDINGDNEITTDDRFGYIIQFDTMQSYYNAAGELIAGKDADDYPVMGMNSARDMNIIDKILDVMYSESALNVHYIQDQGKGQYFISQGVFTDSRALFMWIRLAVVAQLRNMENDFGIIPPPKYEESQTDYYSTVNVNTSYFIAVPRTVTQPDRSAIILEALCSLSHKTLATAYYDVCLSRKYTRDDESQAMLDLIFKSTVYDFGQIYNFGGFSTAFLYLPSTKGNRDFVSLYESYERKIDNDIDKLCEVLDEY